MSTDGFAHDRFLVDQLVRPMVNLYRVTPLAAGEVPPVTAAYYVREPTPGKARAAPIRSGDVADSNLISR